MSERYPVRPSYPHLETELSLKRRRTKSPKPFFKPNKSHSKVNQRVVKKPRIHDYNGMPSSAKESLVSAVSKNNVKVEMLMPTVSGLDKAFRILRLGNSSHSGGILSMPTETLYSMSCFLNFQRGNTEISSSWKSLNNMLTSEKLTSSRPHVLLHKPSQAFEMVNFSTPKTFVHKHVQDLNDGVETPKVTWRAVKFSESYEVLKRLSSTVWPGTSTIYAPVRMRTLKRVSDRCDSQETTSTSTSKVSGGSISSLSSESNENQAPLDPSSRPSFPILPNSALLSKGELFQERGKEDGTLYVGMRCPSHPLAQRVLAEAYRSKVVPTDGNEKVKMNSIQGAVVGISPHLKESKGVRSNSYPVTAEIVCDNLASPSLVDAIKKQPETTIHVLNGEATDECFSVPSCQFANAPSTSLIIDSPSRTVFIRREKNLSQTSSDERSPNDTCRLFHISNQDVLNALHQVTRQPNEVSVKLRVIDAIMQKWSVIEL